MKKHQNQSLFFSYGHDEYQNLVFYIKDYLEKNGFKVFIDNDKLHAGNDWEIVLEDAISNYTKFVFFITKYSARRPDGYCLNEVELARRLNKEIIPILLENETLPLSIVRLQYLDFQHIALSTKKQKLEQKIQNLIKILNGDKKIDEDGIHARLIHELEPIDFAQDFQHHKVIGCEWIVKKVDQWLSNNPESRILWITAEAGYGKSALAAYLAQFHPQVIGIHFCVYSSPEKKDPRNVIKTLAFHFQNQIGEYYDEIKNILVKGKSLDFLMDSLILNPLERISSTDKTYVFIIDAIDEAMENNTNQLAKLISEKFNKLPSNIKIIITSRPEPYLRQMLAKFKSIELNADIVEHREDCERFVKNKLKNNSAITDAKAFTEELLKQSEYNMLYLVNYFEGVEEGFVSLDDPIGFPRGLDSFYIKYFDRIFDSYEKYSLQYAPIFEIIYCFSGNIDNILLAKILNITITDIDHRLYTVGTLLKKNNNHIQFYHKSLEDWLQSHDNYYEIDIERATNTIKSFLASLETNIYLKFYQNKQLNYLLAEYSFNARNKYDSFLEILEKIPNEKDRYEILLNTVEFLIEKKQYRESQILIKQTKRFIDVDIKDDNNLFIYYLKLLQRSMESKLAQDDQDYMVTFIEKTGEKLFKTYKDIPFEYMNEYIQLVFDLYGSSKNEKLIKKLNFLIKKFPKIVEFSNEEENEYSKDFQVQYEKIVSDEDLVKIPKYFKFSSLALLGLIFALFIGYKLGPIYLEGRLESVIEKKSEIQSKVIDERNNTIESSAIASVAGWTTVISGIVMPQSEVDCEYKTKADKTLTNLVAINAIPTPIAGILATLWGGICYYSPTASNEHCASIMGATIMFIIFISFFVIRLYIFLQKRRKRIIENIITYKKTLLLMTESFENNPQKWAHLYVAAIKELVILYRKVKKFDKANKVLNQHLDVIEQLYINNPNRWKSLYEDISRFQNKL